MVLAGAGSGKTRIVTFRIAHLIQSGIPPNNILAVTFTNKAAGEMQERIHDLTKGSYLDSYPTVCTFHSLGCRILRESIHHLGFQPNFTIYDAEDSAKLLRGCLQSLGVKKEVAQQKVYRGLISKAKDLLQGPHDIDVKEQPHDVQKALPELYKLYQERLYDANAVDFDDLLFLTVRLFQEHEDVLEHYQSSWPFLLIDEYQDTNYVQYLMARLIAQKSGNIFAVGDPDQSIYSWRGANIRNILDFEKDYPGAKIVRLEQNYRSKETILHAANALISHNFSRYEKNLWSNRGVGEKIVLYVGENERDEASFVIEELLRLNTMHKIPLHEMTVFYRTNFQSRQFEDSLLRNRVPYIIVGGISFYQRKEIKDVLAFLHMVHSDKDFIAFSRTLNTPKRGIGDTTLEKIRGEAPSSLLDFCLNPTGNFRLTAKQKHNLNEYATLIQGLREVQKSASLQDLVIETIKRSHYYDYLREDKETYEDRRENVGELVAKAVEWDDLTGFLEELSLKSSLDTADTRGDKLNLMTLHNGKGLEFSVIFLVGMEEDLCPHANARASHDAIEEERRLCYVGMTRAKERLYLTAAETRFLWGSFRTMRPSRFLREIPSKYMEKIHAY